MYYYFFQTLLLKLKLNKQMLELKYQLEWLKIPYFLSTSTLFPHRVTFWMHLFSKHHTIFIAASFLNV